jgi:hypothetical protein
MSQSAIPPLDDTLGAIEIGGVVCTFLFGIGTLQTFYYYGHFSTDSKLLKSAVCCSIAVAVKNWSLKFSAGWTLVVTMFSDSRPQLR